MANTIEYIFSLQDKISAKIGNITVTSDRMLGKFADLEKKNLSVNKTFNETGRTLGALREKIAVLQAEREWIPAENIEGIRAYNREMKKLNKEINKLESLNGGKFKKWSKEAFAAIPSYVTNPLTLGAAAVGFSGKSAMNFDEGMAKVNLTAQLDEKGLADLSTRLQQVAAENHTDISIAPVGLEKIISQVGDADLSINILDTAMKGAKASGTDLDTVSAALAQTLSVVGAENTNAREVLDTFLAAKRVGAGEFADFAKYMPGLIAGASNMGVNFKEVAGTFAYMTGKGQSAERAAVLMENAFSVLGKADIRGKMEKAGIKVFDEQGKMRGMVDIFTDLKGVLNGMTDEQKSSILEKFGLVDKEAKNAFALMTSDLDKLQESMNATADSTGETDKALELSRNAIMKATDLWNDFKNIGFRVGMVILPAISVGLDVLTLAVNGLEFVLDTVNSLFAWWGTQLQDNNPYIWGLTAAIAALSAILLVNWVRINATVIALKAMYLYNGIVVGATRLWTTVQWALNEAFLASPLGWIVVAIGAVVGAVVYCWNTFEGFRRVIYGCWETVKEFGRVLLDAIVAPFKQVLKGVGGVCSALLSLLKGNFKQAATEAKEGFMDIGKGVLGANPVSIGMDIQKKGNWEEAWDKGTRRGSDSWRASKEKADSASPAAVVPDAPAATATPVPNKSYEELDAALGGGKQKNGIGGTQAKIGGAQAKTGVLNLNDRRSARNYKASSDYTAATQKLAPVQVNLAPKGMLLNVRRIAAAAAVPLAMSAATPSTASTDAYAMQDAKGQTEQTDFRAAGGERSGKTIQVDRVCDQIIIHVANTDGKGVDTIRQEVIKAFKEIYEV